MASVAGMSSTESVGTWEDHWKTYLPTPGEKWIVQCRQQLLEKAIGRLSARCRHALTIVEAGCGAGHNSYGVAKKGNFVLALDLSAEALATHCALYPASSVSLVLADIYHMPLPDDSVDLLFNAGVLEHFTDSQKQAILREFARVLRPNGILFITVPGCCSFWRAWRSISRRLDFGYEEYHTPRSIAKIVELGGFDVLEKGGIDPLSLNTFLLRFLGIVLPLRGLPCGLSTEVFVLARRSADATGRGEPRSNGAGEGRLELRDTRR